MSNFKEKYRRDNKLLKAPKEIPEEVMNMTKENNTGRKNNLRVAAIAAAACLVIAVLAAVPFLNRGTGVDLPLEVTVSIGDLRSADDYSELYQAIAELRNLREDDMYGGMGILTDGAIIEEEIVEEEAVKEEPATAPTYSASDSMFDSYNGTVKDDYSQTNTQKENVDEGDIIKTDGQYIYRLTNNRIFILDPHNMTLVSSICPAQDKSSEREYFSISDIYVSGDRLAALCTREVWSEESEWRCDSYSGVLVYDITDRSAPVKTGDFFQSGYLNDSRMIGDYVYLVTSYGVYNDIEEDKPETYVPVLCENGSSAPMSAVDICILPNPDAATYAVVSSVNIVDGTQFTGAEATFGHGNTVYADTERIVLAFAKSENTEEETTENGENVIVRTYEDSTKLISYTISNGAITLTATGEVPGALLNQFALDRHNGVLRVVTTSYRSEEKIYTDGIDRYEWNSSSTNGLYTLDDSLNIIGKLDGLAEDERVYSVRFSGDIGYFVTFRQVDPLFAVDLSDPTAPALLSALKIPGFSQYMHPYADGLMFGLGMDADEETGATRGMKLSMFDISDPADVTEKHKLLLSDISHSEALYNHKAILISADKDVIAFPTWDGYLVYGYNEDGFYERYELELDRDKFNGNLRSLYIGDSFYICSDYTLFRFDMNTFLSKGELTFASPEDFASDEEEYKEIIFATNEAVLID